MSDPYDREPNVWWLAMAFIAGVAAGVVGIRFVEDILDDDPIPEDRIMIQYSMYDFNLAPFDDEGNLVTNPTPEVFSRDGVPLVALMTNPYTGEPFHFQAINSDTRLCDLDIEFAACKRLFEYGGHERVVDVFEKMKTKGKKDQ